MSALTFENPVLRWTRLLAAPVLVPLALADLSCASTEPMGHHFRMRGEVLAVSAQEVSVHWGSDDGAEVGQELEVFRLVRRNPGAKRRMLWTRVKAGVIRIEDVLDAHRAHAHVVSGEVKKGDVVKPEVG